MLTNVTIVTVSGGCPYVAYLSEGTRLIVYDDDNGQETANYEPIDAVGIRDEAKHIPEDYYDGLRAYLEEQGLIPKQDATS